MNINYALAILLLLTAQNSNGQFNIYNKTLTDTFSNILFLGIRNQIEISFSSRENIALTSNKSSLIKISKHNYIALPQNQENDTLYLKYKNTVLFKKEFKIKPLPHFRLSLGAITDSLASKEEIIANKRFQIYVPGCNCPLLGVVAHFKISFISNNILPSENYLNISGNSLDQKAIALIRKLNPKDQVIFEDIFIQDIDSSPRNIPKLTITIR